MRFRTDPPGDDQHSSSAVRVNGDDMKKRNTVRASKGLRAVALPAALIAAVIPTVGGVAAQAATVSVIVQGRPDQPAAAARAVEAVGGSVTYDLSIVHGVAADVPADAVERLRTVAGVRAVTPNAPVHVQASTSSTSTNTATLNSVFAREVQADLLWAEGIKGAGITVALIDTGVTVVPDLAGRVVTDVPDPVNEGDVDACANFSGHVDPDTGDDDCTDQYGHGTFLAGLIAGNGASSNGLHKGVAPDAQVVSIKIAGPDGSSDVSKLLAALQYVVTFRDELGIDVLNLSLGTDSTQSYTVDPLNYAVEQVWREGVAVVVAAGNLGPTAGSISKPGDDPFVITVGAVDDRETPATSDDRVPNFSGRGPTATDRLPKPDITAPGSRLVSLRAPGSHVEATVAGGLPGTAYRRGSGTSMSAAVVSGAVALLLDKNEAWSPDRVKHALSATATRVGLLDPRAVGAGLVQAHRAANLTTPGEANLGVRPSTGMGSLEASRGTVETVGKCSALDHAQRVLDPAKPCLIEGDETASGEQFDNEEYTGADWAGTSWYESQWDDDVTVAGTSWYGTSWYGTSWYGTSWYGTSWYGASWEGGSDTTTKYGDPAAGGAWYGAWQ